MVFHIVVMHEELEHIFPADPYVDGCRAFLDVTAICGAEVPAYQVILFEGWQRYLPVEEGNERPTVCHQCAAELVTQILAETDGNKFG